MEIKGSSIKNPADLDFYGGRVLKEPSFHSVFLGSFWKGPIGQKQVEHLNSFSEALPKSKYANIWKEYGAGSGDFISSTVSSIAGNKRTFTESSIIEAIEKVRRTEGKVASEGSEPVYTVFLPPGAKLMAPDGSSSFDGLGGYHGSYDDKKGKRIYYAGIAYSLGANGIDFNRTPQDNISIVASHEWSEIVTDPDVNNGKLGWYNEKFGEVGDIPINIGMALKDVWGRLGKYAVQKEWSNKKHQPILKE